MKKDEALQQYNKAISLARQRIERLEKQKAAGNQGQSVEEIEQELVTSAKRLKALEEKVI